MINLLIINNNKRGNMKYLIILTTVLMAGNANALERQAYDPNLQYQQQLAAQQYQQQLLLQQQWQQQQLLQQQQMRQAVQPQQYNNGRNY